MHMGMQSLKHWACMYLGCLPSTILLHPFSMSRRSTHSKKLTPATVADSNNDFIAVASESDELFLSLMSCILSFLFYYHCLTYILFSILGSIVGKDAESDGNR
jgi:hypothetical protein